MDVPLVLQLVAFTTFSAAFVYIYADNHKKRIEEEKLRSQQYIEELEHKQAIEVCLVVA
jgi:hypothetical protein